MARSAAAKNRPDSTAATTRSQRRCVSPDTAVARRPPQAAPTKNAASAVAQRATEYCGAPARAKPQNTTFPVMLAVKTRPRPSTVIASTIPVVAVNIRRTKGNGSNGVAVVLATAALGLPEAFTSQTPQPGVALHPLSHACADGV